MTLPVSPNAISLSQVNTELGLSSTATITMNDSAVRTLFGVASGAISMSDGWGKSNRSSATYTFSANTQNASLNITTLAGYVAGKTDVTVNVNTGVYLWASTTGNYGLNLTGGSAGDVITLVNAGYIMGCGGKGADSGAASTAGGPALNTPVTLKVNNTGYIGGGGGGGGTGGPAYVGVGGGGAGGGVGGTYTGYGTGQTGGTIGTSGSTGGNSLYGGGGGGGRIMPGTGGAGASASVSNAGSYGSSQIYSGAGGGSGGGGGVVVSSLNTSGSATGGSGGSAGAAGGNGTGTGSYGAGGGGGGWGASGGSAPATQNYAPSAGGKAINTNGNSVTWIAGQANAYGSVA